MKIRQWVLVFQLPLCVRDINEAGMCGTSIYYVRSHPFLLFVGKEGTTVAVSLRTQRKWFQQVFALKEFFLRSFVYLQLCTALDTNRLTLKTRNTCTACLHWTNRLWLDTKQTYRTIHFVQVNLCKIIISLRQPRHNCRYHTAGIKIANSSGFLMYLTSSQVLTLVAAITADREENGGQKNDHRLHKNVWALEKGLSSVFFSSASAMQ